MCLSSKQDNIYFNMLELPEGTSVSELPENTPLDVAGKQRVVPGFNTGLRFEVVEFVSLRQSLHGIFEC